MRLPEPWCEFCHTDGKFDYHEWHAILCGIGDGLQPWHGRKESWCIHAKEWHYYTMSRGITTFLATCMFILFVKGVL